jgi:hypothetical protein
VLGFDTDLTKCGIIICTYMVLLTHWAEIKSSKNNTWKYVFTAVFVSALDFIWTFRNN